MRNAILGPAAGFWLAALAIGFSHAEAQSLPGIDAIVERDDHVLDIKNEGLATYTVNRSVIVLNADGREAGRLQIPYDRFSTIRKLRGEIRDSSGRRVRRLGRNDEKDYGMLTNDLQTDYRLREAELFHHQYPYTVEYEYELRMTNLMFLPRWQPHEEKRIVTSASYKVIAPQNLEIRYHTRNFELEPEVRPAGRNIHYLWKTTFNLPLKSEPYGPPAQRPTLKVTVSPFQVQRYRGDLSSWEDYGRFYALLSEGRDRLPNDKIEKVQALVADLETDREKAQRLYEYMQSHTRYVSIQLGIGGWQPFEARHVVAHGYGDCKALTNYMHALLKAVGINSYPALIRRGFFEREVPADFPNPHFNHVILNVPLEEGEVWLECTSRRARFGEIGADNENRFALLVTPEGGRLVRTPETGRDANRRVRTGRISIDAEGNADASITTVYSGVHQEFIRLELEDASPRDRENWLREQVDIPTFRLKHASFDAIDAREPEITLPIEIEIPRFASRTGSRMFVRPNVMSQVRNPPPDVQNRRQPVHLWLEHSALDSLVFRIPAGYSVESMMEPVHVETDFARFSAVAEFDAGTLVFRRQLETLVRELPAERYPDYQSFMRQVVQADRGQVVFVRQ